jgi:hypothetical protein
MPHQLTALKLMPIPDDEDPPVTCFMSLRLSAISTLAFLGDPVPGGMITLLWALASQKGNRVVFVQAEQAPDKSTTMHARGDDKKLLLCLTGYMISRNALISALQPGMKLFHQKVLV